MVYAEPTVKEPLRIEVIPAGSNTPILVKERGSLEFRPVGGALVRAERGTNHPAVSLPPRQASQYQSQYGSKQEDAAIESQWKYKQSRSSEISQVGPRTRAPNTGAEIDEGLAYLVAGSLYGLADEVRNVPIEEAYQTNAALNFYEFYSGYVVTREVTAWAKDTVNNAWDALKDGWNNLPDFQLPRFELPKFKFPSVELPKIDLPNLDLPEINLPRLDFNFPDFSPFNEFDQTRDRELDDLREKERNRQRERNDRRDPGNETYHKTKDLIDQLDDDCLLTLTYTRIRFAHLVGTIYNGIGGSQRDYRYSEWEPFEIDTNNLLAPGEPNRWIELKDGLWDYGHYRRKFYFPSGSHSLKYEIRISSKAYSDAGEVLLEVEKLIIWIPKTSDSQLPYGDIDYFIRNETTENCIVGYDGIISNISQFALTQVNSTCSIAPPPPLDIPPLPPEDFMNCCSCTDIALVVKQTMQSLKYKVKVPIVSCVLEEEVWTPKVVYKDLEIFATDESTATAQAELYRELAYRALADCEAKNLINKLSLAVGVDEYPATVPASIISKDEGFIGNLIPNPDIKVANLTQFIKWFFERSDEVWGQWEVPIEVKDSDPTKSGDQPVGIKLPNLAEYAGESMGLQLQANINLELLVNMCTRLLIETGQDKQQNFKSYMMSEAIAEYLGFEQKQVVRKMPLSFKPGEEDFSAMLQETEVDVSVPDCVEKTSLQKTLARVLEFTSRAQAAVWRSLDPRGDMKGQIISLIKGFANTKDVVQQKEQDDDDFQRFTEDAEIGFTNATGITDTANPYGGSYAERPRIREIGDRNSTNPPQ